jgi:membrane associated rhomboid family serine protease
MENLTVNTLIVIVTGLISFAAFSNSDLFLRFAHNPYVEERRKEYYRMLTSGFIHANWAHLLVNMITLWSFGSFVEKTYQMMFGDAMGRGLYLLMYLSAIVVADLPTFNKHKNNPSFLSIGASGAVSAVLFASILFNPWGTIYVYFFPVNAIIFGVLYLGYTTYASRQQNDNIDHEAHFTGAMYGILFTILIKFSVLTDFVRAILHESPYW